VAAEVAAATVNAAAAEGTAALAALVAQHAGATVRIADARATGACETGIESWCRTVGLPYDAGQTTLGAVWVAYCATPRAEARATVLHVLRRQRAAASAVQRQEPVSA